jgi:hypothetical protein
MMKLRVVDVVESVSGASGTNACRLEWHHKRSLFSFFFSSSLYFTEPGLQGITHAVDGMFPRTCRQCRVEQQRLVPNCRVH